MADPTIVTPADLPVITGTGLQAADQLFVWRNGTLQYLGLTVLELKRGLLLPRLVTANAAAVAFDLIDVDTSAGEVTVTLPASPADRDKVWFNDLRRNWATANLVIDGNGKSIGAYTSVRCTDPASLFVQYDATAGLWHLFL